jgi:hypothetical protein
LVSDLKALSDTKYIALLKNSIPDIPPSFMSGGRAENTPAGDLKEESTFMNSKVLSVWAVAQNDENNNIIKNLFIF